VVGLEGIGVILGVFLHEQKKQTTTPIALSQLSYARCWTNSTLANTTT